MIFDISSWVIGTFFTNRSEIPGFLSHLNELCKTPLRRSQSIKIVGTLSCAKVIARLAAIKDFPSLAAILVTIIELDFLL